MPLCLVVDEVSLRSVTVLPSSIRVANLHRKIVLFVEIEVAGIDRALAVIQTRRVDQQGLTLHIQHNAWQIERNQCALALCVLHDQMHGGFFNDCELELFRGICDVNHGLMFVQRSELAYSVC